MKYFFIFVVLTFFTACGPNSSSNDFPEDDDTDDKKANNKNHYIGTLYQQQWAILKNDDFYSQNKIDENAHIHMALSSKQYTGKGIKVAIIDNGFDTEHIEIKDKIIYTYNAITGSSDVSQAGNEHHGTSVAGIIAGTDDNIGTRGVAPDVSLILIKMPERLSDSSVIEMFNKAVEAGADIINCSWGTGNVSDSVKSVIRNLGKTARDGKGVLIVFASGNRNKPMGNDESSIDRVFAVGATDETNLRTSYSDFGSELDIVAPGGSFTYGITTIDPSGSKGIVDGDYIEYNAKDDKDKGISFIGTSSSAPIVSGILALLLEQNKNLTRKDVALLIQTKSDKIGYSTPYIEDLIVSNIALPLYSGQLGTSGRSDYKLEILDLNGKSLGIYPIASKANNKWESQITDPLKQGEYQARLITQEGLLVALDKSFIVDLTAQSKKENKEASRSRYYGYGKINADRLLGY
jgi:subtilisin family serine protease